jgi:hypothetical protein
MRVADQARTKGDCGVHWKCPGHVRVRPCMHTHSQLVYEYYSRHTVRRYRAEQTSGHAYRRLG